VTSIHLPALVTVIGESYFFYCHSLVSITFDPASKFRESAPDMLAGRPLGQTDSPEATALFDDFS
jgi:hypothetical protein